MTITELHIKLDLQPENKINILKDAARKCNEGYIFVDSSDGHCYLFDENGNEDDIKKIKSIRNCVFAWCESLKSIIIPDSVKRIRNYAFYRCKSLKSLTFKGKTMEQVKEMANYPFGIADESIIRCI